jgi:hypothetical protein
MSLETPVQKRGWAMLAKWGLIWRLNTGMGWVATGGKPFRRTDGSVVVPGGRPIALGFSLVSNAPVVGAGDLIGGTRVRITPAMVGMTVLVFTSAEAKRTDGGRTSKDQKHWRDTINNNGGIAGIFSSPEEAEAIVVDWARKVGAELV